MERGGWRAMYLAGLLPVLLVAWLRRGVRETASFESLAPGQRARTTRAVAFAVWRPPWRRPLVLCILLFGLIGAVAATFPSFYAYFLVNERGFAPSQVSTTYGLALAAGLPSIPLCGWMLDRWGRRVVGVVAPLFGAAALVIAFNAAGSPLAVTVAGMFALFIGTLILPVQVAYAPELFPTALRAVATSWITNGAGRALAVASPALTGALAGVLGSVSAAASSMAVCGVLAALLVYLAMPETRGRTLEETSGARAPHTDD